MSGWKHGPTRSPEFRNAAVSGCEKAELDAFVLRVVRAIEDPRVPHAVTPAEIVDMHFAEPSLLSVARARIGGCR